MKMQNFSQINSKVFRTQQLKDEEIMQEQEYPLNQVELPKSYSRSG